MRAFATELYAFIENRYPDVFRGIAEKKQLDDQIKGGARCGREGIRGQFRQQKGHRGLTYAVTD